jgi:hypothetical protein
VFRGVEVLVLQVRVQPGFWFWVFGFEFWVWDFYFYFWSFGFGDRGDRVLLAEPSPWYTQSVHADATPLLNSHTC